MHPFLNAFDIPLCQKELFQITIMLISKCNIKVYNNFLPYYSSGTPSWYACCG